MLCLVCINHCHTRHLDAADASPEARMPNGLRTHWNEQMALELALEVSRMQEMTLLLARVRFSEQTPSIQHLTLSLPIF